MPIRTARRTFLAQAAGTLAVAAGGRLVRGQAAAPARRGASELIRTAIIGIRGQGRHHIAYHQASPNMRIAALCDIDESLFADRVKLVKGGTPIVETDFRRILDNREIDCVSIATPNHWHALLTVLACQAGKDVYVEKPMTYCISEGRKIIEAARRYNRVVQVGTNARASKGRQEAMRLLKEGIIGEVYMARGIYRNPREPIGIKPDSEVPKGVNYDRWLGPAPVAPFNANRFHYNWHWNWTFGNGELGNNGPHFADVIVEGLGKEHEHPVRIASHGGRFVWKDQGQTPNVQVAQYTWADGTIASLEVSNLPCDEANGLRQEIVFYGPKGYLVATLRGEYQVVLGKDDVRKGSGLGAHPEHVANFYEVVRSRRLSDLLAPVEGGHAGASLCHLGNIAYRLGRTVEFDPKTETFPHDPEATKLATREYRKGYEMPEKA